MVGVSSFRVSLLLFTTLVACGGSSDTPSIDAPPDADGATSQPIVVLVGRTRTGPVSGVPVVFGDADGALVAAVETDTVGRASAVVTDGAVVTVVDTSRASDVQVYALSDVPAGETITIELTPLPDPGTPAPTVGVDFTPFAGASGTLASSGCVNYDLGPSTDAITFGLDSRCLDTDGQYSILALAHDETGAPLAWAQVADVPTTTSQLALPAWNTNIAATSFVVDGLPTDGASDLQLVATTFLRGPRVTWSRTATVSAGHAEVALTLPAGAGDGYGIDASVSMPSAGGFYRDLTFRSRNGPSSASSLAIAHDLASNPLPFATSVTFDPTLSALSWTVDSGVGNADVLVGLLAFTRDTTQTVRWSIVAPPDRTRPFALPELPSSLAAFAPTATDVVAPALSVVDATEVADTQAFRAEVMHWLRRLNGDVPNGAEFHLRAATIGSGDL